MGTAMGRQAVVSIVALQGLLLAACGATSTGQPAAGPTTTMGATVQTVRTGATVGTTDSALAGLPEILTPPPGVAVAPSSTPGSLTLDVGGDPATTLTYYAQRLTSGGYRVAQLAAPDATSPEILFGNGQEGGAITTAGSSPHVVVSVHLTSFPATSSLPKTFTMPAGMFRYDYRLVDGVAHHFLFVPSGGPAAAEAIRSAASDAGYQVTDGSLPAGATASLVLAGFGASARVDLACAADACRIELYRTS